MTPERTLQRRETLLAFGASASDVEALLRYNERGFAKEFAEILHFPLPDASFVSSWREYAAEVDRQNTLRALYPWLTELDPGAAPLADVETAGRRITGEDLREPERGRVILHPTLAGTLPAMVAGSDHDFVVLVQALARRGRADALPSSMGALLLGNYKNKHRYRNWLAGHSTANRGANAEQDYLESFAILRPGPYSGVPAQALGITEERWQVLSPCIRLEHECAHYFTRRVLGGMRINIMDELIADFTALREATGAFDPRWELLFLGLEQDGAYRSGARLENYLDSALCLNARAVLEGMVRAAVGNLARFDRMLRRDECPDERAASLIAVACSCLEELARPETARTLFERRERWLSARSAVEERARH